jgi:hypothetical protein
MTIFPSYYSQHNNSSSKLQNSKINFGAGWSVQIEKEIEKCNISQITDTFNKQGITTDFKDNKVVAWCSLKTLQIFNELNRKYKLKLALPKAIYVEDFSKLKEQNSNEYGICNWYPAYLKKDSDKVYSERTVLFNSFESNKRIDTGDEYDWQNINAITERFYKDKFLCSNHFLAIFIHEFGHAAHNANLINKFQPEDFLNKIRKFTSWAYSTQYNKTFGELINISKRATDGPFEAISEDMTKKITASLDESILLPTKNPFVKTLYPASSILKTFRASVGKNADASKILRKIWNGEDILQ